MSSACGGRTCFICSASRVPSSGAMHFSQTNCIVYGPEYSCCRSGPDRDWQAVRKLLASCSEGWVVDSTVVPLLAAANSLITPFIQAVIWSADSTLGFHQNSSFCAPVASAPSPAHPARSDGTASDAPTSPAPLKNVLRSRPV